MDTSPALLVELVESEQIPPCKTIDLGCGTGNYTLYLASKGFDVTGVDISISAITIVKQKLSGMNLNCNFIPTNLLGDLKEIIKQYMPFS